MILPQTTFHETQVTASTLFLLAVHKQKCKCRHDGTSASKTIAVFRCHFLILYDILSPSLNEIRPH